jgi:uncharacterized repeat protein (TIGR03943 family)
MTSRLSRSSRFLRVPDWLNVLAIAAWGVLLLQYWLRGKLGLLIHPNYFGLTIAAGFTLLLIAVLEALRLLRTRPAAMVQHLTLFPPGWMSGVLLAAALLGLMITPRAFASQTAIQRGLADTFAVTRAQPQAFRSSTRPEARSLIDWVRTLAVYPEPDAYTGQKVKVQGFVVYPPNLSDDYFIVSRFVITCCAADAYPVGLPVKLSQSRQAYPPDRWLEVEGRIITENLDGKRQLTIQAHSLKPIPEPENPYSY